ncbi:MAG: ParA family protein [Actinomycetota bacterium]
MKIVSIINQKGGVGKTTTCANLGAGLALLGQRTLVIDLDPQANLTLGMGVLREDLPYRLHDTLLDPAAAPLHGIITHVQDLPLYLAPGHLDLARAEPALLARRGVAYHLRDALKPLVQERCFDWVLIDCPPSLGALTQNAIVASSHLLVPTEPKMYAFAGMNTLNQMILDLAKAYSFQIELLGVLLTMYDRSTRLHRTISTVIRERFGERLLDTIIYKNVRISEAELEGKPILLFDPKAAGARNYLALANEVVTRANR